MSKLEKRPVGLEDGKEPLNTHSQPTNAPKRRSRTAKAGKKRSKNAKNVPKPTPKPGSPEFKALCKQWYAKLAETGFKDLERPHPKTGYAGPDSWLNAKSLRDLADDYDPLKADYYRKLTHFVTHRGHAWDKRAFWRFAARLYVEGHSYRSICRQAKAKGHVKGVNVFTVFNCVRKLEQAAEAWWARSVHGGDDFGGEDGSGE